MRPLADRSTITGPVLVTGATGFIGRHLTEALVGQGVDVHAVVRRGSARRTAPGVVAHVLDDTVREIAPLVTELRPASVVHLATLFAAQHTPDQIERMIDANVTFGTALAEGCSEVGARLVHATSAWQHVDGAAYSPVSLYAATKQAFVDVLQYYTDVRGLVCAELCLFDTYGPRDDRHKLVWLLLEHAASGVALPMSSGRQLIDLTHVSDVVEAVGVALTGAVDSRRLTVRSGAPRTVRQLVELVGDVTGRPLDVAWGARPDRPREMTSDWDVPGTETGWRPRVPLEAGIAELWTERADHA